MILVWIGRVWPLLTQIWYHGIVWQPYDFLEGRIGAAGSRNDPSTEEIVSEPQNLEAGDEVLLAIKQQTVRAMTLVLKLLPFDLARRHGQLGVLAFQSLHPTQFIRAEHPFALLDQF